MENINIRKAVAEDCAPMLQLVHELALYEKAPQEVTVTVAHFKEKGFGANPVWWAFVSENDAAKMVGMALYYIRYSTWKGATIYLEDIIVTEAYRGQGIGTKLFDAVIAEAVARDIKRISWQVLEWNAPAINFYKKYNAAMDAEWVNCSVDV